MSTPSVNGHAKQKFTRGVTCPVCGGCENDRRGGGKRCFGFISGDWIHCTREDCSPRCKFHAASSTYSHRLKGKCHCGVEHNPGDPPTHPFVGPPRPSAKKLRPRGDIEHVYKYHDRSGIVRFEVVRYKPKDFKQRQPKGDGTYQWNLDGIEPYLYNLPAILAAGPEHSVWITEGEKDVDLLGAEGRIATCNPGGAGKWKDSYSEALRGRHCRIIPDNDLSGRNHAQQVALSLQGKAASVKVVELPLLPEKGDVNDFLDSGRTTADLDELARQTEEWKPAAQTEDEDGEFPINRTELGNSIRLVNLFGARLRYCGQLGYWLVFHGAYWQPDHKDQIWKFGKATVRNLAKEAAKMKDDEERKAMLRFAIDSEKKRAIQAMIDLAKSDPKIAILPDELDRDPYLLNCLNGTLELRTGRLREHRPEDLITKITKVAYRPNAPRSLWEKTLGEIQPDPEMRAYIKRALGYSISGDTGEHALFLPHGKGRNGKNTVLDPVAKVLGEYATGCDPKILLRTGKNDHPTGLADLHGRRMVITDEVDEGEQLAEALVKRITGNPTLKARFMRQDFFTFDMRSKIWMPANHKPDIKGRDEGIWSRIRVIPFDTFFPPEKRIKNLASTLVREEGEGILAWLVEGYLDWQKHGLAEPVKVLEAVSEYRLQQDVIAAFLKECCLTWLDHPNRDQFKIRKDDLYLGYASWCKENGEKAVLSGREFGSEMTSRGFTLKPSNNVYYRHGISLSRSETAPDPLKQGVF